MFSYKYSVYNIGKHTQFYVFFRKQIEKKLNANINFLLFKESVNISYFYIKLILQTKPVKKNFL